MASSFFDGEVNYIFGVFKKERKTCEDWCKEKEN